MTTSSGPGSGMGESTISTWRSGWTIASFILRTEVVEKAADAECLGVMVDVMGLLLGWWKDGRMCAVCVLNEDARRREGRSSRVVMLWITKHPCSCHHHHGCVYEYLVEMEGHGGALRDVISFPAPKAEK